MLFTLRFTDGHVIEVSSTYLGMTPQKAEELYNAPEPDQEHLRFIRTQLHIAAQTLLCMTPEGRC